jgi:hypothetical protein
MALPEAFMKFHIAETLQRRWGDEHHQVFSSKGPGGNRGLMTNHRNPDLDKIRPRTMIHP